MLGLVVAAALTTGTADRAAGAAGPHAAAAAGMGVWASEKCNISWSYEKATHLLSVFPKDERSNTFEENKFVIAYRSAHVGSTTGSNAFGVKKKIDLWSDTSITISDSAMKVEGKDVNGFLSYRYEGEQEPEIARAETRLLTLVIEGEVRTHDPSAASCDSSTDDATIDSPLETRTLACNLDVTIDRLAYEAGPLVLKEWTAPSARP